MWNEKLGGDPYDAYVFLRTTERHRGESEAKTKQELIQTGIWQPERYRSLFDEVYANAPPQVKESRERDEQIFSKLSEDGLLRYGHRKSSELIITTLAFFPAKRSLFEIPFFFTNEQVKSAFKGHEILRKKFEKSNLKIKTPKLPFYPDKDKYALLVFDQDKWLQSYEWTKCFALRSARWDVKEEQLNMLKWLSIIEHRYAIRKNNFFQYIITATEEHKQAKNKRAFKYMAILTELCALRTLEEIATKRGYVSQIKMKSREELAEIWEVPIATFFSKTHNIESFLPLAAVAMLARAEEKHVEK